ncbi:hypothetical protein HYU12_02870 [Candidatus Woesearchaeota archaeon]|nr:hypothetical protein [Candidatus Woesearchaeota archaeon]
MGLPLFLAGVALAIAVALAISSLFAKKGSKENINSLATLFIMLEIFLVFLAAITDDPVFENIPPIVQIVALGVSGIAGFWKLILVPIFNRLTKLEVGQGEIKTDISNIKTDVHMIKESLIGRKSR